MSADLLGADKVSKKISSGSSPTLKGKSDVFHHGTRARGLATIVLIFAILVLCYIALIYMNKTLSMAESLCFYIGIALMSLALLIVNYQCHSVVCFGITVVAITIAIVNSFILSSDFGDNGLVELFNVIIFLLLIWFLFETGSWIGFAVATVGLILMTVTAITRDPSGAKSFKN